MEDPETDSELSLTAMKLKHSWGGFAYDPDGALMPTQPLKEQVEKLNNFTEDICFYQDCSLNDGREDADMDYV